MLLMLIIIPDLLVVRLVPCGILYLIRGGVLFLVLFCLALLVAFLCWLCIPARSCPSTHDFYTTKCN